MDRRRALKSTTALLAAPIAATQLAGCAGRLKTFTTWQQARQAVALGRHRLLRWVGGSGLGHAPIVAERAALSAMSVA